MRHIERRVRETIERTPRAALDMGLLLGLIYERQLGRVRAGQYTLRYCEQKCAELGLPSRGEVEWAYHRVMSRWRRD